jgi:hypothetical protein
MRNTAVGNLTVFLVCVTLGALFGAVGVGSLGHSSAPAATGGLRASVSQTASTNWGGYAATTATGAVTYVAGTWVQPTVTCPSRGTLYAAFWVGIDGYSSSTVEQDGTLAECSHGKVSYSAWWELYPLNSIQTIGSMTVKAGDSINATVTYTSSGFTMAIKDLTGGTSYSHTATQSGTSRNSAECIAERPSVGSSLSKLADFGSMKFTTCTTTISGSNVGIGSAATVDAITMEDNSGLTLASVSSTSGAGAFTVTWVRSS